MCALFFRERGLALLMAIAACMSCNSAAVTSVRLDVTADPKWGLAQYEVVAEGRTTEIDAAPPVRLLLADTSAGRSLKIELWGKRGGVRFAYGRVDVTPVLGKEVAILVTLARLPCGAWCAKGTTNCQGAGTAICEQRDDDDCFEWSEVTACPVDSAQCSNGLCAATCVDECAAGERRCAGPGGTQICGQGDADACLEWLPRVACGAGDTCSGGACGATCHDECAAGAGRCQGRGVSACGDLNHDGCTEWGPDVPCGAGTTCNEGKCATDACTDGAKCDDGDACTGADTCGAGVCKGTPKTCAAPPAPECTSSTTLRAYASTGTCSKGVCSYVSTDTTCNSGCAINACMQPGEIISAGGEHTCGIKTDGTVVCWGYDSSGLSAPPPGMFASVSAGSSYTCGVKADQTVACWGRAVDGEMARRGTFVSVSVDGTNACGVKTDGTLACWWDINVSQVSPPLGTFLSVSVGIEYACAIKTDGTVACWGTNHDGQAIPPPGKFLSLGAGAGHVCGVKTDGTLACWGYNVSGQASPPPGIFLSVTAGFGHTCALKTDSTIACWGDSSGGLTTPPPGKFAFIDAGQGHTCGVRTDGTVACWGYGTYGKSTPPAGLILRH